MKIRLFKFIKETILYPKVLSNQTLGQSLQFVLDMLALTNNEYWRNEAKALSDFLITRQNQDGGFGIGYNWFGAGKKHKAKSSTAPETEELYSLMEYYAFIDRKDSKTRNAIEKGLEWIKKNAYKIDSCCYGIPYDPSATNDIFILNGVSFAVKCISMAFKIGIKNDQKLLELYHGFTNLCFRELERVPFREGKAWKYFYQKSPFVKQLGKWGEIIENHHIGQQLAAHALGYQVFQDKKSFEIVKSVSDYLLSVTREDGLIPYSINIPVHYVDIWGLASCIVGLIESYKCLRNHTLIDTAEKIVNWLFTYAFHEEYFYPTVYENGTPKEITFFPRSDAWVIHSIAHYILFQNQFQKSNFFRLECLTNVYKKIKSHHFVGKEKFAWNLTKKFLTKFSQLIRREK